MIVGNRNGYIGFGQGKDVQVGDAIKKAITKAKMNLVKVRRGCGRLGMRVQCYALNPDAG